MKTGGEGDAHQQAGNWKKDKEEISASVRGAGQTERGSRADDHKKDHGRQCEEVIDEG